MTFHYVQHTGEHFYPYPLNRSHINLSKNLRKLKPNEAHGDHVHHACFIGFVALKAGVASIDEVLGDHGIVHNLVHAAIHINGLDGYNIDLLEDIEKKILAMPDEELHSHFEEATEAQFRRVLCTG